MTRKMYNEYCGSIIALRDYFKEKDAVGLLHKHDVWAPGSLIYTNEQHDFNLGYCVAFPRVSIEILQPEILKIHEKFMAKQHAQTDRWVRTTVYWDIT